MFAIKASLEPSDAKNFVLTLKEPSGLVIDALGNSVSPGAFMSRSVWPRRPSIR